MTALSNLGSLVEETAKACGRRSTAGEGIRIPMSSRVATDAEVDRWRDEGWVLLDGLIGTEEIDATSEDVELLFPSIDEYYADPEEVTVRRRGRPLKPTPDYVWPEDGPGFRSEQQQWAGTFPFEGS